MHHDHIRYAVPADLPTLVEFNIAMALETEGLRLLPELVTAGVGAVLSDASRGFYLVALRDEVVVGSMLVTPEWSDWRNGLFWWVQSVYVRPQQRRQGVFRRLYQHVQDLAAADPTVCGFRLYVEKNNAPAQRTYASLGMEQTHYVVFEQLKSGIHFHD